MAKIPSNLKYDPENHLWIDHVVEENQDYGGDFSENIDEEDAFERADKDIEDNYEKQYLDIAYIGLTDYAQDKMGELLFVDLPVEGETYLAGDIFSSVESGKKDQDLTAPFDMQIQSVQSDLEDEPELINEEPYENWICKVILSNPSDLDSLMDADDYMELIAE